MNWYNKYLRTFLLITGIALQFSLPSVQAAAPVISDGEIDAVIRDCDALENDPALDPAGLAQLCAAFEDPGFLHNVTNQREVWLEKIERFNETPVVVFDSLGAVNNYDPSFGNVRLNLDNILNVFNLNDENNGEEAVHFELARQVRLGILAKDLLKPALHFGSLFLDINSVAGYFDSIIDMITDAIVHKEDVVLYNLNIMLETKNPEFFATTFQNLDEALHKEMRHNNQMRKLLIQFFKRRIIPACLEHLKKSLHTSAFILNRAPRDRNAPPRPAGEIPVISITDHWPVRLALQPIVEATAEQFDLKINEWVSGYKDKRPAPLFSMSMAAAGQLFSNLAPKFVHCGLDTILELAKQTGFASTFDDDLWFSLSTELIFTIHFFYRTLDFMAKDHLLDMLIKKSIPLKTSIEDFERRLANPRYAHEEKQLEIKKEFKAEIYSIVLNHFGPMQPILLEKMRKNHNFFQTVKTAALLVKAVIN